VPFLLYANKQDLLGLLPDEIISLLNLFTIKEKDWAIYSCAALKGDGI